MLDYSVRLLRHIVGLSAMTPKLRWVLGVALSRPEPTEDGSGFAEFEQFERMNVGNRVLYALAASLASDLGEESEAGRQVAALSWQHTAGALAALRPLFGGPPGRTSSPPADEEGVHAVDTDLHRARWRFVEGERPAEVNARLEAGRIVSELTIPESWPRPVFARGCSNMHLVLDVLEESADYSRLRVDAVRWEEVDGDTAVGVYPAEVTMTAPGNWETRWLDT